MLLPFDIRYRCRMKLSIEIALDVVLSNSLFQFRLMHENDHQIKYLLVNKTKHETQSFFNKHVLFLCRLQICCQVDK